MALRDLLARLVGGTRGGTEDSPLPTQRAHRETVDRALKDVNATTLEIRRRTDQERESLASLRGTR